MKFPGMSVYLFCIEGQIRSVSYTHLDVYKRQVMASVKKTGMLMIASDACQKGSIINDFAQNVTSALFNYLDAPPVVLGARNWITPVYELEDAFFPQADWFLDAYHQKIKPLAGYTPGRSFSTAEMDRRNKLGV